MEKQVLGDGTHITYRRFWGQLGFMVVEVKEFDHHFSLLFEMAYGTVGMEYTSIGL